MICLECTAQVPDASEYCPECGFPFDNPAALAGPAPEQPAAASAEAPVERAAVVPAELPVAEQPASAPAEAPAAEQDADLASAVAAADLPSQPGAEPAPAELPTQAGPEAAQPAAPQQVAVAPSRPLSGHDYIVNSIVSHINEIKVDIINNPIKAFVNILGELDNSNRELQQTIVSQGESTINGVQETALAIVSEVARLSTQQHLDALAKSQELALTIVSEINAATSALQEANSAANADLSESIKQIALKPAPPAPAPPASAPAPDGAAATATADNTTDYILYLCIAMAIFTMLNFFITIYAVKLIK